MAAEYQMSVTFDEVEVGDLILVELFGEDNWTYLGDRRGIAKEKVDGIWYFEGMHPVYRGALGYRMFKVTEKIAESIIPTAELERLRKIEAGLKEIVAERTEAVHKLRSEAFILKSHGAFDLADSVFRDVDKIVAEASSLEALLGE